MHQYDTVVAALNGLKQRGYTLDFNIAFDKLICADNNACLNPAEFEITEIYRFEGETNPSDEDIVYAVESKDGKMKGNLHTAYGTYNEEVSPDLLKKLTIAHH
ncbi:MAG: phosphoribosylpyrophosphate synthetase [Ferruginibacter sp.]